MLRFFDSDDMYSPLCSLVYFKGIEECGMARAISFQGREFLMLWWVGIVTHIDDPSIAALFKYYTEVFPSYQYSRCISP